jgi:hypothetical protein
MSQDLSSMPLEVGQWIDSKKFFVSRLPLGRRKKPPQRPYLASWYLLNIVKSNFNRLKMLVSRSKILVLLAMLSLITFACKSDKAQEVIPKKDGLWKEESRHTISSTSGTVTADVMKTDSLRTYYFGKDYQGYYSETGDTAKVEYNWWKWSDKDSIVIESNTFRHVYDVVSSAQNAQTWQSIDLSGSNNRNKVETTVVLKRIE